VFEGDPIKLIEVENKIKYNESIIRHLFISVKEHSGEDSQLLIDSKDKKNDREEIDNKKAEAISEEIKTNKNAEVDEINSQDKDKKLENEEELESKDKTNGAEDE
jgi:hypothetical protein